MPKTYMVTLKDGANEAEINKAKETAKEQGGKIEHEYTLIKGFTVQYPDDTVVALKTNDHINVEEDSEMKTQ